MKYVAAFIVGATVLFALQITGLPNDRLASLVLGAEIALLITTLTMVSRVFGFGNWTAHIPITLGGFITGYMIYAIPWKLQVATNGMPAVLAVLMVPLSIMIAAHHRLATTPTKR